MRKILKRGEMYLDVAIKMAISLALAGLLWNTFPILVGKPFLSMPVNGLIKDYSYSDNKNTYKNTVKDADMLVLEDMSVNDTDPAEKTTVAYPTVPTAPTNPTLSQDGTNISASWSAPLSDGGASICGYHVYVDDSLVTQDLITGLQYTITGIDTSEHEIAITAVNKEGESEKATAYFQTKAFVPEAPINLSAKISGTTATVSWSAPVSNGGSKILGYNLYRNNTKINQNFISGTTYSCKNLKAGTYTFYVTAINKVGSSQESSSVTIEIKTKPDPPTNVNATISDTKINVSWDQPENNGGSQILGYNIYINNKKQNSILVAGDSFSFTPDISGGYKVYVTAVNAIGESEAAGSEILTISASPGIPTNLSCEVTDNQEIKITWQKPDETGNSIITGYNIYLDGTKLNPSPVSIEGTADTGVYLTSSGQSPGIHSVAVSAINGYGEGDKAYKAISIFVGPSAPQAFTVSYTRNNINKITASWSAPVSNGGLDILGYNLYIDGKRQNTDLITDYTYSMGLLSPGTYTFEVRAVNTVAEGQSATKQLTITPEYQYTDGALFTTKDNGDGTCSIIGFSKTANIANVFIPPYINGKKVTSLKSHIYTDSSSWITINLDVGIFYENTNVKTVTIPNTVTSLKNNAFFDCTSLTSINIPNSVITIGDGTFCGCTSLTSINIPNSVISIGNYAFSGCTSLASVNIPNSVTSIGSYVFWFCKSLTSIQVDQNNKRYCDIDGVLFNKNKTELIKYPEGKTDTSYNIPDSVILIDGNDGAFDNCTFLTLINIPNSVTSIGDSAFGGCTSLKSINIPNSVTSIGDSAFGGCTSLKSINIPNSVTSIGKYTFNSCTSLTSVNIPNSVITIGDDALLHCTSLTSINIPDSVTSIGEYAFDGCTSLTLANLSHSLTAIKNSTFEGCTSLKSINIPNSVTSIGDSAFSGCTSLASVNIPNSVISIGDYAFGRLLFSDTDSGCKSLTSINIPGSVTSIGEHAFDGCTSLTSANISHSVTSIKDSTFRNCTSLKSINIPNSVTSIGNFAFAGCISLASINIPNSVITIGNCAFSDPGLFSTSKYCKSLISINIPSSVKSIGNEAFAYWQSSQTIFVHGKSSQYQADAIWGKGWRQELVFLTGKAIDIDAKIVYCG